KNKDFEIFGLDNINEYYDPNLKYSRLKVMGFNKKEFKYGKIYDSDFFSSIKFLKLNLEDYQSLESIFNDYNFDIVCNLAAQAGVRYSIENPKVYMSSNIHGFLNILECCRKFNCNKLVYASSSSVYGNSDKVPFCEDDRVDTPVSLYAASKKSNELMAYTYSHLFKIETIGLRFFTVYGPWGRPDMAYFLFADAILKNKEIKVFNNGNLSRDFTYIDDIVDGIYRVIENDINSTLSRVYNIGNNSPVNLLEFIKIIEKSIGIKAKKEMVSMQPGDVNKTWANVTRLSSDYGYISKTSLNEGIPKFINWFVNYYDK
ncbi:NAD-dependent epimerase/dehydratase family protein, partial [bacterium]|nr:NAD-dependent epimerase/dehydratase family protein [bacterium]